MADQTVLEGATPAVAEHRPAVRSGFDREDPVMDGSVVSATKRYQIVEVGRSGREGDHVVIVQKALLSAAGHGAAAVLVPE